MQIDPWFRAAADELAPQVLAVPDPAAGVCTTCRDLIPNGYRLCRHCRRHPHLLDAVAPIALSVAGGAFHATLRRYKDAPEEVTRDRLTATLAELLARYLAAHEGCVTRAARAEQFDVVTVVPSSTPLGDDARPRLRELVGDLRAQTAARYRRVLRPMGASSPGREFDPRRFHADRNVVGQNVLLVDDTWVTGARVQSAAAALRAVGAERVAAVVLGRHVNPRHPDNAARMNELRPLDVTRCALEPVGGRSREKQFAQICQAAATEHPHTSQTSPSTSPLTPHHDVVR